MEQKTIKKNYLYKGFIINVRRDVVKMPNKRLVYREIVEHKPGVSVVPIVDDTILFVKQFRIVPNKVILELPAGLVDSGEDTLTAAIRELQEETGYASNDVTYLGKMYTSPGFTDETITMYMATNLFPSSLPQDEFEDVTVVPIKVSKAKKMLENNEFEDMKTAFGVSMYLNYLQKELKN